MEIIYGSSSVGRINALCDLAAKVSVFNSVTLLTEADSVNNIKSKILENKLKNQIHNSNEIDVIFASNSLTDEIKESNSKFIFIDALSKDKESMDNLDKLEKEMDRNIVMTAMTTMSSIDKRGATSNVGLKKYMPELAKSNRCNVWF